MLIRDRQRQFVVAAAVVLVALAAPGPSRGDGTASGPSSNRQPHQESAPTMAPTVRVAYLHHSTGQAVWNGGVPQFIESWNAAHGTDYRISELTYPATLGAAPRFLTAVLPYRVIHAVLPHYPWSNYPYDYWNLWVAHAGTRRDRGELNLDDIVKDYDVVVFKHCFPVSGIQADDGAPSVASQKKTLANYKLQYEALKARLRQFPSKRFIVWTGAALAQAETNADEGRRAQEFSEWVKDRWDEKGDNIFVWDFRALETEGQLYLRPEHASGPSDSHPNPAFSRRVAPHLGQRIVDVIEGRGDTTSTTGKVEAAAAVGG